MAWDMNGLARWVRKWLFKSRRAGGGADASKNAAPSTRNAGRLPQFRVSLREMEREAVEILVDDKIATGG